jgi:phytoene dehydrogenase-like protein
METYDVVVIGAGNGGLTAAVTLAQKGLNVLLLERHNIPGGCATSFCRGRFEFEVALHQLSGLGIPEKPGPLRGLLDRLGVTDKLEFLPMSDLYHIVIPGRADITLKPDRAQWAAELQKHFPHESEAISNYLELVYALFTQVIGAFYFNDPEVTREKYPLYFQFALRNVQDVLDRHFKDPLLKAVVSPYWVYMGLPPRLMSFVDMAAMLFSYLEFIPFHIKGGSQALSNALADAVIGNGGTIRFNCGAKKIKAASGKVCGVVTEDDQEISTPYVISNASKITTYVDLMDREHVPDELWDELRQCSPSQSAFTIYMGLDGTPQSLGITQSTNFIFGHTNPDLAYERMKVIEINDQDYMLLSCYNLIDPACSPEGTCQAALVTLKYGDPWLSVAPAHYAGQKYRIADSMLQVVEKVYPGLRSHIEEIEIGTPLTHMRYLGTPVGAIYGFDHLIKNSTLFLPNRVHVKGLYAAGGWVGYNGFQPTLESGAAAARAVLNDLERNRRKSS